MKKFKSICHSERSEKSCHIHKDPSRALRMTAERGRSMVEMLGVLAVIGLLTIIGIAGFKIAMNKAKANNLVADMNRLAHVVSMDKFSGYGVDAIDRAVAEHNEKTEYPAIYKTLKPGIFTLETAEKIDKKLCEQVAGLGWKVPLATFVDGAEKKDFTAEDCGDSNTLTWAFTDDLSACPDCVVGEVDCSQYGNNGTLECGSCTELKGFVADNSKCANNENGATHCVDGRCSMCAAGSFWRPHIPECKPCQPQDDYWSTVESSQHNCLGKMFYQTSGYLFGCNCTRDGGAVRDAEAISCRACENRCFTPEINYCRMVGTTGYKRAANGDCEQSCEKNYFWRPTKFWCEPCRNFDDYYWTVDADKHNCLGSMFYAKGENEILYGCHSRYEVANSDRQSCLECGSSRCFYEYDNSCRNAGADKAYVRNEDGTCSCNTIKGGIFDKNFCYYCPVNKYLYKWGNPEPYCKDCQNSNTYWGTFEIYKDHCPGSMYYEDGSMWSCNHNRSDWKAKPADKASCILCAERCYLESDQSCRLMGNTYDKDEVTGNCVAK